MSRVLLHHLLHQKYQMFLMFQKFHQHQLLQMYLKFQHQLHLKYRKFRLRRLFPMIRSFLPDPMYHFAQRNPEYQCQLHRLFRSYLKFQKSRLPQLHHFVLKLQMHQIVLVRHLFQKLPLLQMHQKFRLQSLLKFHLIQ